MYCSNPGCYNKCELRANSAFIYKKYCSPLCKGQFAYKKNTKEPVGVPPKCKNTECYNTTHVVARKKYWSMYCSNECRYSNTALTSKTKKRIKTALQNRGHTHHSKHPEFAEARRSLYSNKELCEIDSITNKQKKTNTMRYGTKSYVESEESKQRWQAKYGVDNPSQIRYTPLVFSKLNDVVWLKEEHETKSILEIANDIGVNHSALCRRFNAFGIKIHHRKSYAEKMWLDELGVQYRQHKIVFGDNKYVFADGYDSQTNTVYEFWGDYWHGNPVVFDKNSINYTTGKTFGYLYAQTLAKIQKYKEHGYNVVDIWESDWVINGCV